MSSPKQTAWDCALRYLGQRAHGSVELRVKLERRGFEEEEIDLAMDRLRGADLLDDEAFGAEYARTLIVSRGLSKAAAMRKLREKGLSEQVTASALAPFTDDEEYQRALELAQQRRRKLAELDPITAKRRILAFLARRGYPQSICYRAVSDVFA